jgi:hypothetical protein
MTEAIRRLVELGLTVKTPARPTSKLGRKLRAQELATKRSKRLSTHPLCQKSEPSGAGA